MPIPAIPSYPMPAGEVLPENSLTWRPDPARAVLLVHDMQQYFLAPFDGDDSPRAALETNVARLRAGAAAVGVPVVYTAQPGAMTCAQRGLLHDLWGPGMARDDARDIPSWLAPTEDDTVLTKWRYSAFHDTGLDELLADLGRDQMVVTGVYANTGCLVSAVDAFSRDIETFVVHDAVADFSAEDHRQALHYAATRCAVVLGADEVLGDLAGRPDREGVDPCGG